LESNVVTNLGLKVHPTLGFSVTMLHFESRPGFFVTAGLWEPNPVAPGKDPGTGKRAGVL